MYFKKGNDHRVFLNIVYFKLPGFRSSVVESVAKAIAEAVKAGMLLRRSTKGLLSFLRLNTTLWVHSFGTILAIPIPV